MNQKQLDGIKVIDAALAHIEAMDAEIARLKASFRGTVLVPREELASLRAEAARYRWLREQHWNDNVAAVVRNPRDAVRLGEFCPSGALLDDFVDAAMKDKP